MWLVKTNPIKRPCPVSTCPIVGDGRPLLIGIDGQPQLIVTVSQDDGKHIVLSVEADQVRGSTGQGMERVKLVDVAVSTLVDVDLVDLIDEVDKIVVGVEEEVSDGCGGEARKLALAQREQVNQFGVKFQPNIAEVDVYLQSP